MLLEGFGTGALLVFRRLGTRLRDDLWAGLWIGLATAVKYSPVASFTLVEVSIQSDWQRKLKVLKPGTFNGLRDL